MEAKDHIRTTALILAHITMLAKGLSFLEEDAGTFSAGFASGITYFISAALTAVDLSKRDGHDLTLESFTKRINEMVLEKFKSDSSEITSAHFDEMLDQIVRNLYSWRRWKATGLLNPLIKSTVRTYEHALRESEKRVLSK